jgi:hypothetical protein
MYKPEIKNGYYQFDRAKLEALRELYKPKRISKLKRVWRLFITYILNAQETHLS